MKKEDVWREFAANVDKPPLSKEEKAEAARRAVLNREKKNMPDNLTVSVPGITVTTSDHKAPGDYDLLRPWFDVVRSLHSVARRATKTERGRCHAVISVAVAVDRDGHPIIWGKPGFTRLEPRRKGEALEELLRELGG